MKKNQLLTFILFITTHTCLAQMHEQCVLTKLNDTTLNIKFFSQSGCALDDTGFPFYLWEEVSQSIITADSGFNATFLNSYTTIAGLDYDTVCFHIPVHPNDSISLNYNNPMDNWCPGSGSGIFEFWLTILTDSNNCIQFLCSDSTLLGGGTTYGGYKPIMPTYKTINFNWSSPNSTAISNGIIPGWYREVDNEVFADIDYSSSSLIHGIISNVGDIGDGINQLFENSGIRSTVKIQTDDNSLYNVITYNYNSTNHSIEFTCNTVPNGKIVRNLIVGQSPTTGGQYVELFPIKIGASPLNSTPQILSHDSIICSIASGGIIKIINPPSFLAPNNGRVRVFVDNVENHFRANDSTCAFTFVGTGNHSIRIWFSDYGFIKDTTFNYYVNDYTVPANSYYIISSDTVCPQTFYNYALNSIPNYYIYTPFNLGYINWQLNGSQLPNVTPLNNTTANIYHPSMLVTDSISTQFFVQAIGCEQYGPTLVGNVYKKVFVNSNSSPWVWIQSSDTTVCSNTTVTYTAFAWDPGTNPIYQWYKNNLPVGSNSSTYSYIPQNGDAIKCELMSNAPCPTPSNTSTSDSIVMSVTTPIINIASNPSSAIICSGDSISLTATGASTYNWSGGINNGAAFNPSSTATYSVTATDINGCSVTSTKLVTVNPLPTISILTTPNDTVCASTPVILAANGGSTYSWTGGITNGTAFTPTSSGAYTVTVTGANGCTKTQTQNIVVNSLPTISISATPNDTVCAGTAITLTANGGLTYSWTGGITNGTAFTPTTSGTYTVTVTGANGCTKTQTQNIVVNLLPTISISALPNDTVCAGISLTLTANGGSSYSWTGGITNGIAFTPTISGTYTVTATSVNGCVKTQTQNILVNSQPAISISALPNDTVCAGTPITLTANGGASYSWTGGITNGTAFTPTASGTYTVTVTGVNGCTKTQIQNIVVNSLPAISISAIPNDTVCAGTAITLTANGGLTYSWTGGITNGTAFTPTTSGTYTVTVTSASGCTKTQTQSIVVNLLPTISISATPNDTVCAGTPITLTANGGSTYSWTGGITNGTAFTPTSSGAYTVTVTGANGCTKTQTQSVVVNPLPAISISVIPNDTVCASTPVILTANGGTTYSWTGGITNGTAFTPTSSGTYTVTATGTNGCTTLQTQNIVVNSLPTISISATPNDTVCVGASITLTANGGSSYSWTGGITNGTAFTPTTSGTYTVTATSTNGCTKTQTQSIALLPNIIPTISISPSIISGSTGSLITYTANINLPIPYTINWYRNSIWESVTNNSNVWNTLIIGGSNPVYATISAPSQCIIPDSVQSSIVTINNVTSIHEENTPQIKIYPNPVCNQLFIENLNSNETNHFVLFNSLGEKIFETSNSFRVMEIPFNKYATGLYSIIIKNSKSYYIFKIIKNQ